MIDRKLKMNKKLEEAKKMFKIEQRRKELTKNCAVCNTQFISKRINAMACSNKCRKQLPKFRKSFLKEIQEEIQNCNTKCLLDEYGDIE